MRRNWGLGHPHLLGKPSEPVTTHLAIAIEKIIVILRVDYTVENVG